MSDIEEDYDRLDLGLKFDLSDGEDEDEIEKHEQIKICEFCPELILIDEEVNNENLGVQSNHSNEESIQEYIQESIRESIQEYVHGDVPVCVLQHVYCDPCLLDVDPS